MFSGGRGDYRYLPPSRQIIIDSKSCHRYSIDTCMHQLYSVRLRTRGRCLSIHGFVCLSVCDFVGVCVCNTKMSTLSEIGKHVMCTYHVRGRNEKLVASTYLTSESVLRRARKQGSFLHKYYLKIALIFTTFPYDDYYHIINETSGRSEFRLFYGFPCYV